MTIEYSYLADCFATQDVDPQKLVGEIQFSVSGVMQWITIEDNNDIRMQFEDELSEEQKSILDDVVSGHPTLWPKKLERYTEIDAKTDQLIASGFVYGDGQYCLTDIEEAQLLSYYQLRNDPIMEYPISFSSVDHQTHCDLSNATDVENFMSAKLGQRKGYIDSGNELKTQIKDARTMAVVDAIVDERI